MSGELGRYLLYQARAAHQGDEVTAAALDEAWDAASAAAPGATDEELATDALEQTHPRWRFSAAWLARRLNCTLDGILNGACGGRCCRSPSYWPPAAQPQADGVSCFYLTPTGCRLPDEDKPVKCLLYPLVEKERNQIVTHFRGRATVCKPNVDNGPLTIDAIRPQLVALFGEEVVDRIRRDVLAGRDPVVDVPVKVAAALRAERREEEAMILPPPRRQRG